MGNEKSGSSESTCDSFLCDGRCTYIYKAYRWNHIDGVFLAEETLLQEHQGGKNDEPTSTPNIELVTH